MAPDAAPLAQGGTPIARTINYAYDGLYRLKQAKYCIGLVDQATCNTAQAIRSYTRCREMLYSRARQTLRGTRIHTAALILHAP